MKRTFIITNNVKKFIELTDTLKNAPPNLPKMALVYGDFGLGKSQTILWWITNNDAIYVRCNHKMSGRSAKPSITEISLTENRLSPFANFEICILICDFII